MRKLSSIAVIGAAGVALASLLAGPAAAVHLALPGAPLLTAAAKTVPATFSGTFTSTPDGGSTWRGSVTWRYAKMEGANALFFPASGSVDWTYRPRPNCTAATTSGTVALNADDGLIRLYPAKGAKREYDVLVMLTPDQEPKVTETCPDPNSDTGGTREVVVTVPVGGESYILLSNSVERDKSADFFTTAKAKKLVGDLDHPPAAAFQHWTWNFTGKGSKTIR